MRTQMRWDDEDDRADRLSNRGMCIECGGSRALCGCVRPAMEARLDFDWGTQDTQRSEAQVLRSMGWNDDA